MTRQIPRALALVLALVLVASLTSAAERPGPIPTEVFVKRRAALVERLRGRVDFPVRIDSGTPEEGEHDKDFRVASSFVYLTGLDEPDLTVEIGPETDTLLVPGRNPFTEKWDGPRLTSESASAAALGFREVRRQSPGKHPAKAEHEAIVRRELAAMRLVKDAHEIARLRQAIDITALALAEAGRSIEPGMAEFEVDALIRYVFRREGAERAGFPSIVGSGPNSCILHYMRNVRRMEAGDLVVCDVGAEYGRYTADVTRTFPVSGKFTPDQRHVYQAVLRAQEAGIAAVKPGARVRDVHRAALKVLEDAGLAKYFFHGTSHWLGLDVHDVGDYDAPLEPGMVLTVEPGAYLADRAIGVRIEDDVLVTEWGGEVLSAKVPRAPDEIEALMRERGLGNAPLKPLAPASRPSATF